MSTTSTQQHPLFIKYRREWLSEITGYSKGHLSRVATGKTPLSRLFIERVCFKLNQPEAELFLPDATPNQSHNPVATKPKGGVLSNLQSQLKEANHGS